MVDKNLGCFVLVDKSTGLIALDVTGQVAHKGITLDDNRLLYNPIDTFAKSGAASLFVLLMYLIVFTIAHVDMMEDCCHTAPNMLQSASRKNENTKALGYVSRQ